MFGMFAGHVLVPVFWGVRGLPKGMWAELRDKAGFRYALNVRFAPSFNLLPKARQLFVSEMLDTVLAQHRDNINSSLISGTSFDATIESTFNQSGKKFIRS